MGQVTRIVQPEPAAATDNPLRRLRQRRGLTLTVLADLSGLSVSFLSMVENGKRKLSRRDHVNAIAAALRVPPADIAPSEVPGFDEWAPSLQTPVSAFPAINNDLVINRHEELAVKFTGYVGQGDTYAAGAWLRRLARDPSVSPWLLLDQLITRAVLPGMHPRPLGGSGTRLVSADSTARGRAG